MLHECVPGQGWTLGRQFRHSALHSHPCAGPHLDDSLELFVQLEKVLRIAACMDREDWSQ